MNLIESSRANGQISSQTSAALPGATDGSSGNSAGGLNRTVELSSGAIDALTLAQFFKNLGVAMFNSSKTKTSLSPNVDHVNTPFAAVVANISLVSHHKVLT